ncbi:MULTISPECIES: response regulator transcription factor [Spirosoma]|uniref:Response regulator transcription factor n=1 Tax=Spirosoma liriopis TaxID=2937440 RepID=A0ABT0HKF6_9BACT|nr:MULTISPECIES: response regulator transcription factor [Spirosoma]MCK8492649.1 response regulator transcription factor [Spirosoma liriopis]UHG92117.1 response regulator transcription factor [Spirosoma oryzicola]
MRVLIVEDEWEVASLIETGLEDCGFMADIAGDAKEAQQRLAENEYDIVVLDVNLPVISGFDLCRMIRNRFDTLPILMLTALGNTDSKLNGFDAGADDYLVKPFEFRELVARLRALTRRNSAQSTEATVLRIADLEFNQQSKTVKRGNQKILLTARELTLLEFFLKNQNRALTRNEIIEQVWDLNFDTGTNVVDVYVNYLRKKIDKDFVPKLIHTISGIGYIMQASDD